MSEELSPRSMYVATIGILSALMAVFSFASIVIPTPLGSYDASSVLIFALAILYGPEIGLVVTVIGQLVGKGLLITYSGLPAVYIPGVVAVRGVEAYIVGYLGRRISRKQYGESVAMVIGVLWETGAFVLADIYLWAFFFGSLASGLWAATFTVWTIVDLIWVPLGIAAVYYMRVAFKTQYLDKELNLINPPGHRGVFILSVLLIVLAWGLIGIAGLTGWFFAPVIPPP
ncbi:MAG: ECF transporter S component [Candidatus Hodarchaeota archaeon]